MKGKRVDFYELGSITFEKPDVETFTGFKLAMRAAAEGGSMPTVFNAANEKAVALFLDRRIKFLEIPETIEMCMEAHKRLENPSVDEILAAEQETYELIKTKYRQ
jgi:1-deoxy-D-xylulose-5-phosphate reductoisomerase